MKQAVRFLQGALTVLCIDLAIFIENNVPENDPRIVLLLLSYMFLAFDIIDIVIESIKYIIDHWE